MDSLDPLKLVLKRGPRSLWNLQPLELMPEFSTWSERNKILPHKVTLDPVQKEIWDSLNQHKGRGEYRRKYKLSINCLPRIQGSTKLEVYHIIQGEDSGEPEGNAIRSSVASKLPAVHLLLFAQDLFSCLPSTLLGCCCSGYVIIPFCPCRKSPMCPRPVSLWEWALHWPQEAVQWCEWLWRWQRWEPPTKLP